MDMVIIMTNRAITFENVSKQYKLGAFGSGSLRRDLQSMFARMRGLEDPNLPIGTDVNAHNEKIWALKDVSFKVNKGEAVGIIGRNGAGKSTLLKLLSRVTAPTTGKIEYSGRVASMLEVGTGFHYELTGRENVYLNGAILGMSKKEVDKKFDAIVAFAEMEKFIDTPVKRYSSGMYVKLAFSVAAHLDSEIMVMDEVLAVGDVTFQQKCLEKMADAAKVEGRTVLYVSHNMNTIRQLCSRCIVLEKGELVYDGEVDEAISIYVGNAFETNTSIDLSGRERPKASYKHMRMKHVEIFENSNCMFSTDKNLIFRLDFESDIEADNVYLRGIIRYKDDTAAGVTESKKIPHIKNGINSAVFSVPLKHLINGRYAMSLSLVSDSAGVLAPYYDHVNKAFAFEISDIYTGSWNHSSWGHTRFDEMKIIND